jgi:hypothetical protein
MAMSANTLATELKNLALYDTELAAANAWADAFDVYFKEAIAGTVGQVLAAGLTNCKSAMVSALSGMSQTSQGATKIQAGIAAYWSAIIPASAWSGCTLVTPPPTLSNLIAALQATFTSNTSPTQTKDAAMQAIADTIHGINSSGGAATFPAPIGVQPIS